MLEYLENRFALSRQASEDLVKGSLLSALVNLSMMIPVGIFILMLNEVLTPLLGKGASAIPGVLKYLILVLVALLVIYACQYFQYASLYLSTYKASAERRIALAEKLRYLPLAFFGQRDLSDLTSTIMKDCTAIEHAFSHAIPQLFGAIISTLLVSIALLSMDWRMGVAVLWVIPLALVLIVGSKRLQTRMELKHYQAKRASTEGIQECLETMQDIKACNMEARYIAGLDKKLDEAERAQIRSEMTLGACVVSSQSLLRLGLATTILLGGHLLVQGEIKLLTYLIFLVTAARIYDPLSLSLEHIAEIFTIGIPIKRMKEMEDQAIQDGTKYFTTQGYDLVFDQVGFAYNENEPVLKDVSFTAKQGEITALVGPSGGGKSTAAKLAARFWDVDRGKITLGGIDISTIDPEALLEKYSIVFQDVTLFNDTVMENIRLGRRAASDEEVRAAAKAARCDEFVAKMPKGYQTVIGENGSTLSGGERQRISIARALLKDAPIVLLDEATASLDVENETQIQTALTQLIKNKTVLVIAHRMRTVANADKIVVLAEGYVAQQGTHQELITEDGIYKHMVELQTKSKEWSL